MVFKGLVVDNLPRMLKVLGLIPRGKWRKEQGRKKERGGGRKERRRAGAGQRLPYWPEMWKALITPYSGVLCTC